METYDRVEPISRTEWPGGELAYGGTCVGSAPYPASATGAFPQNSIGQYEPISEFKTLNDPTRVHKRSWTQIKRSGEISFTPYSKSNTKIENSVVVRPFVIASWKVHQQGCTATMTANRFGPLLGHTIYNTKSTIGDYVGVIDSSEFFKMLKNHEKDILAAISTTQQAAFADATSTYDPLTELAEMGDLLLFLQSLVGGAAGILSTIVSKTDKQTLKRSRRLSIKQLLRSSNKALNALGRRWMAYRYALMPIIYSIKDINELLEKAAARYESGKSKKQVVDEVVLSDYNLPEKGLKIATIGRFVTNVSSTYKVRYDRGALQRLLSQSSFNLFTTGWELLTLSFVVDWFFNVNDAIVAATRIDPSTQSLGCTALKASRVNEVILYDRSEDHRSLTLGAWMDKPAIYEEYTHSRFIELPLQRVITESYDRFIFTRPSPSIHYDLNLTWKRIIDGLVLSQKPITKLLRSL